jgi:hypothetical protein
MNAMRETMKVAANLEPILAGRFFMFSARAVADSRELTLTASNIKPRKPDCPLIQG